MSQSTQSQTQQRKAETRPSREREEREEEPRELFDHLREFAQENPASAAMWAFGIGFVLGWRLKPW
jgi:hypothetical protein